MKPKKPPVSEISSELSPIDRLRKDAPHLFSGPDFWVSDNERIAEQINKVSQGEKQIIGRSAGGREIPAVAYGAFEKQQPTATISSANASDRREAFYDPQKRTRPVLALIGSIHGGETEGIALSMNLIRIMETGSDLRGREQSALREKLDKVRLVMVPNLNPDGREVAGVAHLCGAELEQLFLVQQGIKADGTLFRGRKVKEIQPIPCGYLSHKGGYYNADGVNLQHDDFFGTNLAPESVAIQKLFRREIPDAFLTLHSHGGNAAFLAPDAYLSPGYQRKQIEAVGFVLSRMVERGIPITPSDRVVPPPWSFYFQTWLHHATGALPLLFEFCHGLKKRPCTLEGTLDTGLLLIDAWVDYCLYFGPRPLSQELFTAVTSAN